MVGALGGDWGNIKCWQATKPRQPQRKEEMSANELKEEVVEKGLSRFVFFRTDRSFFLKVWNI